MGSVGKITTAKHRLSETLIRIKTKIKNALRRLSQLIKKCLRYPNVIYPFPDYPNAIYPSMYSL